MMRSAVLGGFVLLAAGLAPARGQGAAETSAPVLNGQGETIGEVRLSGGPKGVVVRLSLRAGALTPGWHGAHFHETGDCSDAAAGFKASGGHVGHDAEPHGLLNPDGPDNGDLPNVFARDDGSVEAELFSPFVRLDATETDLRREGGSALVIHASEDDHATQPIGGAGERVACAEIKP